jgi:glycosidase
VFRFQTGTQDLQRIGEGISEVYARSLALLKMTLPGPPFVYYGEELNMVDGAMDDIASTDPTVRTTLFEG